MKSKPIFKSKKTPLGILAGEGELPWIGARFAIEAGEEVRIFNFTGKPAPADLAQFSTPVVIIKIFSSVIRLIKNAGVKRIILLGKARREVLYNNSIFSFDFRLLLILARAINQNDYTIFHVLSKEFKRRGIDIIPQTTYLEHLFLPVGRYGKKCSKAELEDVYYGLKYAREINRLDIGQTVVIGKKSVLAVECAEGTDSCIDRGGRLFNKKGAVVCKTAKKDQDIRFDVPVTGISTLKTLKKSGCRVLAIESKKTFVVAPEKFISMARQMGITIMALDLERSDLKSLKKINAREVKREKIS